MESCVLSLLARIRNTLFNSLCEGNWSGYGKDGLAMTAFHVKVNFVQVMK